MKVEELTIQELIKNRIKTPAGLALVKRKMAKKYKIPCPSNIELLKAYHKLIEKERIKKSEKIENLLKTRPIRSLSGIVNISVLTKPYPCPGKCLYCPMEKGIPKSYVSGEPAVERAKRLNYDPYLQVKKRIEMLEGEGHPTDKIELRIVGGTWSYYPKNYQSWFVKKCFDACNEKVSKSPAPERSSVLDQSRTETKFLVRGLKEAQRLNEKAKHRIVGLSVETRPDFITLPEIKRLRKLGVTLVELGVQSIYDNVLKLNLRGHGIKETILATKLLKDAGFKVLYQMMPNLPGSDLKRDEKMFEELFLNPNFQPDLLKIYPCALLKEAPLYKLWKAGKYKPYTERQLINLIKEIKKKIPYYVRIQRITRDIPSQRIVTGPAKISNLRQVVFEEMKKDYNPPKDGSSRYAGSSRVPTTSSRSQSERAPDWQCRCIRCREVRENYNPKEKVFLFREDYEASNGKEIFLSFENRNRTKLYSLLRLRTTSQNKAIVREIHTYGPLVPIAEKNLAPQHRGLGKRLIREAEKIAKEELGLKKIAVIAGIGARDYFRKLKYRLKDTYMIKNL